MKFFVLSMAFIAVSCGKYKVSGDVNNSIGESRLRSISAMQLNDQNAIRSVCDALTQKETFLPSVVNSPLTFATTQSDCLGITPAALDVEVTLQNVSGNYVFKKKSDNLDFIFPNVETRSSGIFSELCSSVGNLQNPVIRGDEAIYVSTGINNSTCSAIPGQEVCVLLETGLRNGAFDVIHTKEWIKMKVSTLTTTPGRIGFFTHRRKVTQGFCGAGQSLQSQATLK